MHYHREQREEFIRHLADRFPKCFFDNPATRLPLKRNIETDLEKQNVLDHEKIVQAVEWYKSDFRYMRKILTGAERVDLDGKKAGSVTLQEQEDTRRRMLAKKADLQNRKELQQRDRELSRRQAEMAARAAIVLKPVEQPQPPTNGVTIMNTNNHQILIDLARSMAPIKVSELIAAARNKGVTATESTLSAYTYKMIHDGRISKDWIKLGPNFGAKPANGAVATVPAELAPSPKSINTEHLRARIALFESALVGSPNKKIAKQMAADVAKMVADEMAALVKAL